MHETFDRGSEVLYPFGPKGGSTGMDDNQLIQAYYAGDDTAFSQLYGKYNDQLIGYLISKRQFKYHEAEDLAEKVMVKVAMTRNKTSKYNEAKGAAFKTWLYTIVNNEANSFLKSRKNRPTHERPDCPHHGTKQGGFT